MTRRLSGPAHRGAPGALLLALASLAALGAGYEWGGPAGRGWRELRAGRVKESIAAFEEARRENPRSAAIRYDQGVAYRAAGLEDSASAAFQDARRLLGVRARSAAAYNLGNEALRAGRVEEAIDSYRASLREEPGRADAKRNLEEAIRRARAASSAPMTGSGGEQGSGTGGAGRRQGGSSPPPPGAPGEPNRNPSAPRPGADRRLGSAAPSREEAEHWLDALESERRAGRSRDQSLRRASSDERTIHDW